MKTRQITRGAAGLAGAALLWQLAASGPWGSPALPSFTTTLATMATFFSGGEFWSALAQTLGVALAGLVTAAIAGIVLGILIGSFPAFRAATLAVLEFLKPIPPIVILPLLVLVLGPTVIMAWVLVFFGCLLPIIMQTVDGVHDTDPVTKDTARSYGLGRVEVLARVVLPSAMPYIGTAIRVTAPVALIVTVVAGLLGGGPGLGKSIMLAQSAGDYPAMYALVLVLGLLGLVFIGLSSVTERRLLHWHESYREAAL